MSRADEIRQGLRHEGGALTFPLVVEDYAQGHADFAAGNPPPKFSTASYDLGRSRAREQKSETDSVLGKIEERQRQSREAIREMLKDRPDLLADFNAKMAEFERPHPCPTPPDMLENGGLRRRGWTRNGGIKGTAPSIAVVTDNSRYRTRPAAT